MVSHINKKDKQKPHMVLTNKAWVFCQVGWIKLTISSPYKGIEDRLVPKLKPAQDLFSLKKWQN